MTAKEYLNNVRRQEARLRALEAELEQLRRDVYSLKSPALTGRVQSNHQPDLGEAVERLEAYAEKVNAEWDTLIGMREQAKKIINHEHDSRKWAVLYRRYIMVQKWEQIAAEMHYDQRYILELHQKAIHDLENTTLNLTIDL